MKKIVFSQILTTNFRTRKNVYFSTNKKYEKKKFYIQNSRHSGIQKKIFFFLTYLFILILIMFIYVNFTKLPYTCTLHTFPPTNRIAGRISQCIATG